MQEKSLLFILSAVVFVLLIVSPEWGVRIKNYIIGGESAVSGGGAGWEQKNQELEAEVMQLQSSEKNISLSPYIRAAVYSSYPFNFKSEFSISAGLAAGVQEGDAVVLSENVSSDDVLKGATLIGRVEEVFKTYSVIKTVYDPSWKSAVRIGKTGVDALLGGGLEPRLTLIPEKTIVAAGDIALNADARYPYGLPLARVKSVVSSKDQTFQEATLILGYDLSKVRSVYIIHVK